MQDLARPFLDKSRILLTDELLPRIRACVGQLSEEDLWWRPNESSNSIGNLILHLSGNVRQWIIGGVGGAPDERNRQQEFDQRESIPSRDLLARLTWTVEEAAVVIDRVPASALLEVRTIQGHRVSLLEAIYHAVEHFSMHTGQIAYITKLRTGGDLGFYRVVDGIPHRTWMEGGV